MSEYKQFIQKTFDTLEDAAAAGCEYPAEYACNECGTKFWSEHRNQRFLNHFPNPDCPFCEEDVGYSMVYLTNENDMSAVWERLRKYGIQESGTWTTNKKKMMKIKCLWFLALVQKKNCKKLNHL